MTYKLCATTFVLVAIVVTMIVGAFFVCANSGDLFITFGIIGISIAFGAIVGTTIAPFDAAEGKRFSNYGKAIGAFISGYAASKADALINKAIDPQTLTQMTQLQSFRLVAALATALSVAKLTFGFRSYSYDRIAPPKPK